MASTANTDRCCSGQRNYTSSEENTYIDVCIGVCMQDHHREPLPVPFNEDKNTAILRQKGKPSSMSLSSWRSFVLLLLVILELASLLLPRFCRGLFEVFFTAKNMCQSKYFILLRLTADRANTTAQYRPSNVTAAVAEVRRHITTTTTTTQLKQRRVEGSGVPKGSTAPNGRGS